jgi:glycosyltransferase involved in cell wall biosynthesis
VRVLEVITGGEPGGAQRHVAALTAGLVALGHDVAVAHGGGRWIASQVGPTQYLSPLTRGIGPQDRAALSAIRRLIAEMRPDVVHAHSSKAGVLARWAALQAGVPAVYTAHGFVFLDPTRSRAARAAYRSIEAYFGRRSSAVIAVSARDAEAARALGIRRVAHIPNGVRVPERPIVALPGPPWRVGFLARFSGEKGFEVLVDAVARAGPDFELLVAGDGPAREDYRRLAATAGIAAAFLGWQDPVAPFLKEIHVLAVPSWKEGLPYALLDGLAHGVPTVATDAGGMADVLRPLDPALVVPVGDRVSLTMALTRAVRLGAEFREAARAHIQGQYSESRMVAETVRVLEEATRESAD